MRLYVVSLMLKYLDFLFSVSLEVFADKLSKFVETY